MDPQLSSAHAATTEAQLKLTTTPAQLPIPAPIFTTNRLVVRPMHSQDSRSIASQAENTLVTKYMSLSFEHRYTLAHIGSWIHQNVIKSQQDKFVICTKDSPDTVVGGIGFKLGEDEEAHAAEVGYWMGENHWGNGYATETLEGFTIWIFLNSVGKEKKTTRIWGSVFGGNDTSMRCLEKCGYTKEGVLKEHCEKHGVAFDLHLFGLTKSEWDLQQSNDFDTCVL